MQRLYYSGQLNTLRLFSSRSQTFATASSGLIPFDFQSFTLHLHLCHPYSISSHNGSPNSSSSSNPSCSSPVPLFSLRIIPNFIYLHLPSLSKFSFPQFSTPIWTFAHSPFFSVVHVRSEASALHPCQLRMNINFILHG